jgi:hypothetical protein
MKLLKLLFLLTSLFFLKNTYSQKFDNLKNKRTAEIEIVNIDSTQDYYLIYAYSNNLHLKIISRKCPYYKRNIEVSKKYIVTIASFNENLPEKFQISNPCDVNFGFEDGNYISNDLEWGCNLYYANEILGLFYSTNNLEIYDYYNYIENNPLKPNKRIHH